MNILFTYITPFHPKRGGIGRVTDSLTREFLRRGHKVYYLIYPSYMHPLGVTDTEKFDFPVPILYTPSKDLMSEENVQFYFNFLQDRQIDVVINQSGTNADSFLWIKSCEIGIPVISCVHQSPVAYYIWEGSVMPLRNDTLIEKVKRIARMILYPSTKRKYLKSNFNHYQRLIPQTTILCLLSENYFGHFDRLNLNIDYSCKLCAIPNPNSYSNINNVNFRNKKKRLLYVGLLNRGKGSQWLIEIWKRLYKQFKDWEFVVVGTGEAGYLQRLKRLARTLPRMRFEGLQDPQQYYMEASILCMTSINEGWGMVLTEAMQCGCVPMAFDSFGALRDIIEHGRNGLIVKPFDIKDYTRELCRLMNDTEYREKLAANARQDVQKFSVEKVADQWETLFRLINKNQSNEVSDNGSIFDPR